MPDISKIINGKKVMWDGIVYESEKEAQKVKQTYENDNFCNLAIFKILARYFRNVQGRIYAISY